MGIKCVRCGTDNNLRDRTNYQGQCKNCNHRFAFEPSDVADARFKFTDPFFAKAIDDISANNNLFFTPKQLFYLLDKRLSKKNPTINLNLLKVAGIVITVITVGLLLPVGLVLFNWGCLKTSNSKEHRLNVRRANARIVQFVGVVIVVFGIFFSLTFNYFASFVASVLLGMSYFYLGYRQVERQAKIPQSFLIAQSQFQTWINRWQQINDSISKMLPLPREESTETVISTDITAYSFDRAVICDSAAIAQLLIANNFHFENNCAVLSVTGYPQTIFQTVMQMLSRNPTLKVYALHDASPQGVGLVHHLRSSPNWFQNSNATIYDLGLLPRQILSSHNMFVRGSEESAQEAQQLPSEVRQSLSSDELSWLEVGNFVELESFSPLRIIQVLNQGIARSQDALASDSLVLIGDDGYVGGGFIYTSDSFG